MEGRKEEELRRRRKEGKRKGEKGKFCLIIFRCFCHLLLWEREQCTSDTNALFSAFWGRTCIV